MKVAVYSGIIPSTVFIENLIRSISKEEIEVYIFGQKFSEVSYSEKNIKIFQTPRHWILKICYVLFQTMILVMLNYKKYLILIKYYKKTQRKNSFINLINWGAKVLPVINNLPDIFHIQWAKSLSDWIFLKEEFDVKIILSLRGTHLTVSPIVDDDLKNDYIQLFSRVDKFHAVSESIKKLAFKYGVKEQDAIVINGLNPKCLQYEKNKLTYDLNGQINFISVGRFHWIKGYRYALSSIRKLLDINIDVHYTIVTQNSPTEDILYQIEDDGLENVVTFKSLKLQDEVYDLMYQSDFLILPSVDEGLANVVLEAMSIGCIVISSDCGGMKELISHNNNGFLFSNRDVNAMTDTIIEVLKKNHNDLDEIILNARKTIKTRFDPLYFGKNMKKFYESLY